MIFKKNPFPGSGPKPQMMWMYAQSARDGPISPKYGTHSVELVSKSTLVEPNEVSCAVRTFTFRLPNCALGQAKLQESFDLGRGDILKLHLNVNGDQKSYTHKSYSPTNVSRDDGTFDITVKIYPGGANSEFLDGMAIGDAIHVSGPWPPTKKERNIGSAVNLVAYGIGMTEIFEVAKAELEHGDAESVHLLYANRYPSDLLYQEELSELQRKYPHFRVTNIFSRATVPGALQGRIDGDVLQSAFDSTVPDSQKRFLVIGSKPMMRNTWSLLGQLGYNHSQHGLLH